MEPKIRIALLASGNLGFDALEFLHRSKEVDVVLTDKNSQGIIDFCHENSIPLFTGNPRNGACDDFIKKYPVEIVASVNYLFIIDDKLLQWPGITAFNIHGSLLPKYRGRTPHVWALINGEKICGITAHVIDSGCDTGDIIEQVSIDIEDEDSGNDILIKYAEKYPFILRSVLDKIKTGTFRTTEQDHSKATYFNKRTPEDGKINWDWQRERIYNWVRALAPPYPGSFSSFSSDRIYIDKVKFSDLGFSQDMPNGMILSLSPLLVKTPNGVLEIVKHRTTGTTQLIKDEVLD